MEHIICVHFYRKNVRQMSLTFLKFMSLTNWKQVSWLVTCWSLYKAVRQILLCLVMVRRRCR